MEEFGFPRKCIKLSQLCVNGSKGKVRVGQSFSDVFDVKNCLKQGDSLSPLLEPVSIKTEFQPPGNVFQNNDANLFLTFADDFDFVRLNIRSFEKHEISGSKLMRKEKIYTQPETSTPETE